MTDKNIAVYTDYVGLMSGHGENIAELVHENPHPVGRLKVVNALFHAAKRGLGQDTALQQAHGTEPFEVMSAKFYYFRTADTFGRTGEYHQYKHVVKPVADVAFVCSSVFGG